MIVDGKLRYICSLAFCSNFTSVSSANLTIIILLHIKVEEAKKRPAEANTSKTASNKKAKFVTPQKSGDYI